MVAYSFQRMFKPAILAGTKRHTIRGDRKRHVRPGEEAQLYVGMRTKQCELLGRSICEDVRPITLLFDDSDPEMEGVILPGFGFPGGLDGFAISDGFQSWADLKAFWRKNHSGVDEFHGFIISWGDLYG